MARCPVCSRSAPEDGRFCPGCGAVLAEASPTRTLAGGAPQRSVTDTSGHGRFLPGTLLANRYRIVGLLGRGGMGEVYRADDLKLGQSVALKFLPSHFEKDSARLQRFLAEVRIARQISHPSTCRVYDVSEVDGHHFLSMEYVDGEDLASLLRRIGRLPNEKAVQIARQLCAGLAAAHDQGILHRDLKPSNVMVDGRGRAKITDFGLATLVGEASDVAGTPAYMAPEQREGRGVSVRSDLYSLGLVLYEIFTGKHAFDASTPTEVARLQEESRPTNPTHIVEGLDPAVERTILRCLEREPRDRPSSALAVAASLPGGDPLAAALAAGETPSPEMVAAAGAREGLRPAIAWGYLAIVVGGFFLMMVLDLYVLGRPGGSYVPLEKPPDVLVEKAKEILKSGGYSNPSADSAFGFMPDFEVIQYVVAHDPSISRWQGLDPGPLRFWYRQSPEPLMTLTAWNSQRVTRFDPPHDVTGMAMVEMDTRGRLIRLIAVPPQIEEVTGPSVVPDWAVLLRAAGLDPSKWTSTEPRWTPPTYCDARAAWEGTLPGRQDVRLRVEAASYRGTPVYFELIGPWTQPARSTPKISASPAERVVQILLLTLLVLLLVGGVALARRNLRLGRGDRRGAFRLAVFVFATETVVWLLTANHVSTVGEMMQIAEFLAYAWLFAGVVWLLYVALEPYVRRRSPSVLVSWSRLLAGAFRDALVGRDLLVGFAAGALLHLVDELGVIAEGWRGHPVGWPIDFDFNLLLGGPDIVSVFLRYAFLAVFSSLAIVLLLVLLLQLLRRQWVAAAVLVLVVIGLNTSASDPVVGIPVGLAGSAIVLFVLLRSGLLSVMAAIFFTLSLQSLPRIYPASAWYSRIGITGLVFLAAFVLYAFHTSLADRRIFGSTRSES